MAKCPVCGMAVDENSTPSFEYRDTTYYFMNEQHKTMVFEEPEKYLGQKEHHGH